MNINEFTTWLNFLIRETLQDAPKGIFRKHVELQAFLVPQIPDLSLDTINDTLLTISWHFSTEKNLLPSNEHLLFDWWIASGLEDIFDSLRYIRSLLIIGLTNEHKQAITITSQEILHKAAKDITLKSSNPVLQLLASSPTMTYTDAITLNKAV